MASKSKRARMAPQRNLAKTFLYWAITIFVIKLIIISLQNFNQAANQIAAFKMNTQTNLNLDSPMQNSA